MKLGNFFSLKITVFCVAIISSSASYSFAVTDTIRFGGSLGKVFLPSSVNVHVGDTVVWVGFFGHSDPFHELQSLIIPALAKPFGPINTGMSFSYPVVVAGEYHYQCNVHAAMGMIGTFTAGAAEVQEKVSNSAALLEKNFPNPSKGSTTIRYTLIHPSEVSLKIFDMNGKEMTELFHGYQNSGTHETVFDGSALSSGTYTYQLKTGDAVLSQQMIIVKQ